MERRQQIAFDKTWVCVPPGTPEQVSPMLSLVCSRSSPNVKRNEQDQTSVIFLPAFYYRDQEYIAGDQLQRDVKHWLSPPDPSTNHIFVSKARHSGTAAWFFGGDALREWKATGSFLWIHGKRMFSEPPASALR